MGFYVPFQVNSEFYTGWLDHWGDQHAAVDSRKVSRVLDEMLTMGANVNMYVASHTSSSHIWLACLLYPIRLSVMSQCSTFSCFSFF